MTHKLPSKRFRHQMSRKASSRLRRTRVWLDGKEVTSLCFYADPRRGVVRVFVKDEQGQLKKDMERGELARQELRGLVRVKVKR
jgi:hypothetical protein